MSIRRFVTVASIAVPLPGDDIDTDVIFPARFLTLTAKRGLGRYAFHDKRFDEAGHALGFVLDHEAYRGAQVLVAGSNFGCGSSREQAPWALADLGIRVIVARGFGAIFAANCIRNGLLPITLADDDHAAAMRAAEGGEAFVVDLEHCVLTFDPASPVAFEVAPDDRVALLEGRDEIDTILHDSSVAIAAFVQHQRTTMPWLHEAESGQH